MNMYKMPLYIGVVEGICLAIDSTITCLNCPIQVQSRDMYLPRAWHAPPRIIKLHYLITYNVLSALGFNRHCSNPRRDLKMPHVDIG